jgi:hypothetical protein
MRRRFAAEEWVKPEVDPRVPGMGMNKSGKKNEIEKNDRKQ